MQKKLMAIAVAGALGAPAVALAQASTVQIYGQITYEYGIAKQADGPGGVGKPNVDYADTPGGSAIGFRGEEKLGGGLSAWFQCETSADIRGIDQVGLCSRNSAVGFKGGFGNIHFGRWDTPMKRALNVGTVGAEETGLLGMSFLPFGGSGGADATGSGADSVNRQRWKRREVGLTYYESPRFGGFQIMGAFSPGNSAVDGATAGATDATPNPKPRVISLAGIYQGGPLGIGLAYERHSEFGAHAPVVAADADDRAWGASISYKFGPVELGATYLDAKYETGIGQELKKKTATVGVDWAVAGPHSIEAQYAWAGDSKGNSTVGIGGNGGATAPCPGGLCRSDTGGDALSIAYRYRFSKRTSIKLGYIQVDNDTNSTTYRVGNTATPVGAGEKSSAVAFHIRHRF
jgi:predicted porin